MANTVSLPVVDAGGFTSNDWLNSLDKICLELGCFQLRGHGLPLGLLENSLQQMARFFALEREQKLAVERSESNPWGYFDRELTKNRRDWKEIFDFGPAENAGPLAGSEPQWPDNLDGFQPAMEQLYSALHGIALHLLEGISLNLGMPRAHITPGFAPHHSSFLRLNHYPPSEDPETQPGISHHTDAGALTVLLHDARPGLQILARETWYTVEAAQNALIVNIGDIVQVWSNDRYIAPLHRVRTSADYDRYSAPFFLNPSHETDYAPLPAALRGAAPRYRPINWGEFRAGRAAGDYADLGDEIQISDFALA